MRNTSGDVSEPRSAEQSELALRAREIFDAAKKTEDARKLLSVVEIMSKLPDRIDFSAEAPPPVNMDARTADTRKPTGNLPVIFTRADILKLAGKVAAKQQDQTLISQIQDARNKLGNEKAGTTAAGCTWANCCGRWGCWTRCRWW
ncbi:MAG: hypothetical protein ACR2PO_15460 [Methyloligellaceae bacterium]